MTARTDKELLHAAIDGVLTGDDAIRLRERLAEDASLRAEADRLRKLAGVVDSLGPEDVPESFSDRVMEAVARSHPEPATKPGRVRVWLDQLLGRVPGHLQQERPGEEIVRWNTGWTGGGDIVAKKALWAAAGLAVVIILGVVYFNGTRTVDQDAQGTIGGAERYRGTQPSSVAVTEGDVQKFLQSDTFDRIIKDENVLHLLSDREACAVLAGEDFVTMLKGEDAKAGLRDGEAANALRRPELQALFSDAELTAALGNANVQRALRDPELAIEVIKASKGGPEAKVAKKKLQGAAAELNAALDKEAFRQVFADEALSRALTTDANLLALFGNAGFRAFIQRPEGRALFATAGFFEALNNAGFVELLANDANLNAALRNGAALDAALAKKKAAVKK